MIRAALRDYAATDRAACLRLFDSNTPTFFHPQERPQFERFLDYSERPPERRERRGFFDVLETTDGVVGCGGVMQDRENPHLAILRWGMVEQGRHGEGLGRLLLQARLRRMFEIFPDVQEITLFTSGAVAGFYRHLGFIEMGTEPDYYGPGLDQVRFTRTIDSQFSDTFRIGS